MDSEVRWDVRLLKTMTRLLRRLGRGTRTLLQAAVLLVVVVCVLEVGFRLFETSSVDAQLVRPSWTSGQTLRRLVRLDVAVDIQLRNASTAASSRGVEPLHAPPEWVQ